MPRAASVADLSVDCSIRRLSCATSHARRHACDDGSRDRRAVATTALKVRGGVGSHKHAPNKILLGSRHKKLALLLKNVKIPSAAKEEEDRTAAFQIYAAGCDMLRGIVKTQKEKFADVHRENIAYGFRRNVWANRKTGIWINALSLIPLAAVIGGAVFERTTVDVALPLIAIVEALLLVFWVFIVGPDWVRRPADLYAERLLEALDTVV